MFRPLLCPRRPGAQLPFAFTLAALMGAAPHATAQATDPAAAEVLFREARQLLEQGKLDEACPKFMASQRLDPATGTLLAVASCHEQQGMLATAWAEYTSVAGRAEKEGREDRATVARERAKALEPRLSTLTLSASDAVLQIKELKVLRDGVEFGPAVFNRALPIDGGVHEVKLSAPGYVPEALSIQVDRESDTATLVLPVLRRDSQSAPASEGSGASATQLSEPGVDVSSGGLTGREKLGLGIGIAGAATAAVGAGFLIGALIKLDQSNQYCTAESRCNDRQGVELRATAVDWGNLSTVLGIGGSVLAAAGFGLYWFSGPDDAGAARNAALTVHGVRGGGTAQLELVF